MTEIYAKVAYVDFLLNHLFKNNYEAPISYLLQSNI